ncbi:MAG: retropepsin-like aspartic protease, partial [Nitrosomonadaceae bacterium]
MTYNVKIGNLTVTALFDSGAGISVMSEQCFRQIEPNPKLNKCGRTVTGAGGNDLEPIGETFITFTLGRKIFRDRVVVLRKLERNYILGLSWQRKYKIGTGWNRLGKHYLNYQQDFLAEESTVRPAPILPRTQGRVTCPARSLCLIKTQSATPTENGKVYTLNTPYELPKGLIPIDCMHDRTSSNADQPNLILPFMNMTQRPITIRDKTPLGELEVVGQHEQLHYVSFKEIDKASKKAEQIVAKLENAEKVVEEISKSVSHLPNKHSAKIPKEAQEALEKMLNDEFLS